MLPKAGKRRNGAGTLCRKPGSKFWYAVWVRDGKRFQVSTRKTTRKEAEAVLADLTADYARGDEAKMLETVKRNLDRARRERMPLAEILPSFLSNPERRPLAESTAKTHRGRFARLLSWASKERPLLKFADELTLADARAFMATVAAGQTAKTINDTRALFLQLWNFLLKRGFAETNPWKEIDTRPKDTHTKRELDAEQLARLFDAAQGEMKTLFAVCVFTGLRLKDAALLDWRQVDLKNRFITLTPAKTRRHGIEVKIPIVDPLFDALTAGGVIPSTGFVMPETAAIYQKNNALLCKKIQATFRRAGIEPDAEDEGVTRRACEYGAHSLRHTFVSLAFAYGIPLPIVQAIVGHTNAAMTRHYLHLSPAELTAAMSKFKAIPATASTDAPALPAGTPQTRALAVEGADIPANATDAAERPLDALARLLEKMDADELAEAARIVADARRARA